MHEFTKKRTINTPDEIWLLEHYPVFTQGKTGKKEHLLESSNIPVIQSDRGGQITYHGPGQLIMYVLLDLKRHNINVKKLVHILENTVIHTLNELGIASCSQDKFPGVYINKKKICSLGLRIHKGCSMHGLALNVNMDLTPFQKINPCGHIGMQMTQIHTFIPNIQIKDIEPLIIKNFCKLLQLQTIH
ncbi:lipoyl(octanoyl) transferase LipB [Arsenophonus symbiont of Ornithomya chloropus]|uniref:lipoyl(octanoyl) transferase LipB n=1 Tax=Arsenophonus symbiont of Ornithomya chloropus TaxID=634121 RepID=UPI0032B144ED